MFGVTALRTPAIICQATAPSLSLTLADIADPSIDVEVVLDVGPTDTGAEVAAPAILVTEVEQAVDHGRPERERHRRRRTARSDWYPARP